MYSFSDAAKVSNYLENKGIKLTFLIPKDQI